MHLSMSARTALLATWLSFVTTSAANAAFDPLGRFSQTRFAAMDDDFADDAGSQCNSTSCYRYYNNNTAPYLIQSWPDVKFDTGEFYSGSIPINDSDPDTTLFFIFKPTSGPPVDTLTIWFNGGPGCSSLEGFLQENGPISYQPGVANPRRNKHAWSTLTNMIWVEQPVGTGFSTGKPTATNEVDVANQFLGFFKNFETLFNITNYKIYVTGESYAGRYVPYVSAAMLDQNDTTYFDLTGALAYDPCIGSWEYVQETVTSYDFAVANNEILNLNASFMSQLGELNQQCGYTDYVNTYLQFPPPGNQAPFYPYSEKGNSSLYGNCAMYDIIYEAASIINPCFDVYHIVQTCPSPKPNLAVYWNRPDVKAAIHAPNKTWHDCSPKPVFVGSQTHPFGPEQEDDSSPDPIQHVLPQVIEATSRVLVGNGMWDYIIQTNGTLLSIQNMTWNGQLGFQSAPTAPFIVNQSESLHGISLGAAQGTMGKWHYERGLMWVETDQCGHQEPEYQPLASILHVQWLLGMIDTF